MAGIKRNLKRGKIDSGMLYVIVILLALISFSFFMVGGNLPAMFNKNVFQTNPGKQEIIFNQDTSPGKKNLQLQTFTVKNTCDSKIAVDFLIDVSGSMAFNNGIKQTNEKNALKEFTSRMVDSSVIGIQTFSSSVREVVPLSYYKDVKNQVGSTINNLPAHGATYTRDAFSLAKQKLENAISQNKFPGYKYSLIFITDGIPETDPPGTTTDQCEVIVQDNERKALRCFAKAQDPRGSPADQANLATEIKNKNVEIYSLAITSQNSSDQELLPYLTKLMQDVASSPLSSHFYSSDNGTDLKAQLDNVFRDICS